MPEWFNEFFREGSRAAVAAVDEFHNLGVPGFQVGSSVFEGRNENVVRGDRLAETLRSAVADPELLSAINRANRMRDLVIDLLHRIGT